MESEEKKYLSFADIEKAEDLEARDVFIKPWNGWVKMRPLSRAEIRKCRRKATAGKGEVDNDLLEKWLVVSAMVEPSTISPEQYDLLQQKQAGAVEALVTAVLDVCGLSQEAMQEARDSFRG